MIIGPANCGKTFFLKPLDTIYRVFLNPANDKYGWVGADKGEVILLQDFRWSRVNISWKDLLLLLEGEIVKLPAPTNKFLSDVIINNVGWMDAIVRCGRCLAGGRGCLLKSPK